MQISSSLLPFLSPNSRFYRINQGTISKARMQMLLARRTAWNRRTALGILKLFLKTKERCFRWRHEREVIELRSWKKELVCTANYDVAIARHKQQECRSHVSRFGWAFILSSSVAYVFVDEVKSLFSLFLFEIRIRLFFATLAELSLP